MWWWSKKKITNAIQAKPPTCVWGFLKKRGWRGCERRELLLFSWSWWDVVMRRRNIRTFLLISDHRVFFFFIFCGCGRATPQKPRKRNKSFHLHLFFLLSFSCVCVCSVDWEDSWEFGQIPLCIHMHTKLHVRMMTFRGDRSKQEDNERSIKFVPRKAPFFVGENDVRWRSF